MNSITSFDQVPEAVGLILKKLADLESQLSELKEKYKEAPDLPENHDDLLTIDEACVYVKVKRNTIQRWMRERKVPFLRIGGKPYLRKTDLESYNRIDVKKPKGLR